MTAPRTPLIKRLRPNHLRVRLGSGGGTICRLHDELEGLLSTEETRFLYRVAADARRVIEIGSFRGKSCTLMLEGARAAGNTELRITCIDPHEPTHFGWFKDEDHAVFERTLRERGLLDRVVHLRMRSGDARPVYEERCGGEAVDVLWVDGDHSYEGARQDFADWSPLVKPGGIVAGHDAYRDRFPGVLRAWRETIEASGAFGPTQRCRTIAWARKLG